MPRKEPEFRGPCARCGKKTPISLLAPVVHGVIGRGAWYIDKQCQRCAPAEYAGMMARRGTPDAREAASE